MEAGDWMKDTRVPSACSQDLLGISQTDWVPLSVFLHAQQGTRDPGSYRNSAKS